MFRGTHDARIPVMPELRDYLVVRLTGWTHDQILEQPGPWLDKLLAIDATARKVEADAHGGRG